MTGRTETELPGTWSCRRVFVCVVLFPVLQHSQTLLFLSFVSHSVIFSCFRLFYLTVVRDRLDGGPSAEGPRDSSSSSLS